MINKTLLPLALVIALVGCSTSAPVSLGGGQYSITATSYVSWNGANQQGDAVKAANEFCAKEGKTARVTSMKSTDKIPYRSVASGQITFVCENATAEVEPLELANGVYMLAGSSGGYQGIQARYDLLKQASKFCAKSGLKVFPVDTTRESGVNYTSNTGAADTGNTAENVLQHTSADLLFRCVK